MLWTIVSVVAAGVIVFADDAVTQEDVVEVAQMVFAQNRNSPFGILSSRHKDEENDILKDVFF